MWRVAVIILNAWRTLLALPRRYEPISSSRAPSNSSSSSIIDGRLQNELSHIQGGVFSGLIAGADKWTYSYDPSRLALPDEAKDVISDGCAVALDRQGAIYVVFSVKNATDSIQTMACWDSDAQNGRLIGDAKLSVGSPHGLRIEHVGNDSYFYHANTDYTVHKTNLAGEIIWTTNFSALGWARHKKKYWPLRPTDAVVYPGTDFLFVADGYGSSYVHTLNKTTGKYIAGMSFGGAGNGTAPLQFNVPHGIDIDINPPKVVVDAMSEQGQDSDPPDPLLLITDRNNSRLVWTTTNGSFVTSVSTDVTEGMQLPSNSKGDNITFLVPSLGSSANMSDGGVALYYRGDDVKLSGIVPISELLGHMGCLHPLDAQLLSGGNIVVVCWGGPYTNGSVKISYWARKPLAEKDDEQLYNIMYV